MNTYISHLPKTLKAKKYLGIFRIKFLNTIQYRAAAAAGVVTQFAWGAMEILLFKSFYSVSANAMPMEFDQLATYEWLQQAFLSLFMLWIWDNDIENAIIKGDIAYELTRPVDIYSMWYMRATAQRIAKALLRCVPILLICSLIPEPYRISPPVSVSAFLMFILTSIIGLCVVVAITMIVYGLTFFTMSERGIKIFAASISEFLSGAVVPIPFFPEKIRFIAELSPFAAVQNLPLQIYIGTISGKRMLIMASVQIFWLIISVVIGRLLIGKMQKNAVIQGG